MSITVRDCMTLPSLQLGRVADVRGGLDVIVFDDKDDPEEIFTPNELLITSLYCARGDIMEQSRILRSSRKNGAVGIVLFYASMIRDSLDTLIETANQLNLPLIIMPEDNMGLKYSDVISDISEMLLIDRQSENSFVNNSMERIAQLQDSERNLTNVLQIAAYHARASLFLSDRDGRLLGSAYWPADNEQELELYRADIAAGQLHHHGTEQVLLPGCVAPGTRHLLRAFTLHGKTLVLHAITHNDRLSYPIIGQIVELLQLFSSVWNYPLDPTSLPSLVPALLEGDSARAKHIAETTSFPLEALSQMLIFPELTADPSAAQVLDDLLPQLNSARNASVSAVYGKDLFLLFGKQDASPLEQLPENWLHDHIRVAIRGLQSLQEIHEIHHLYRTTLKPCRQIYPEARFFDIWKLELAREAAALAAAPGSSRAAALHRLLAPLDDHKNPELLPTLAVYLLDADSEVKRTSELLFVHRNTILYRLNQVREKLGQEIDTLPMSYEVYLAAALWRLEQG